MVTSSQPAGEWRTALSRFAHDLRSLYGPRLRKLVLYGSRARGDAREDSDVDTLIVLDPIGDAWEEMWRVGEIASRISLEFDLVISAFTVSWDEYQRAESPFLQIVSREGVDAR